MAIATGTAILGAAALGVGASLYSSKKAGDAAGQAAAVQGSSANYATDVQMQYLRESRADIAEAVDKGLIDLDTGFNMAIQELQPFAGMEEYNEARNLLNDPNAIMDRPSTQFQYKQGMEAMQGMTSRSSGGGVSGPSMKAAMEYGQNFASQALDTELNRLFPFINMSNTARTNMANMEMNRGTSKANLRVGGASGAGNLTGQAMPSITSNIMAGGNAAATGIMNQSNINTNMMNSIAGQGTNMALLYAMNPGMFGGSSGGNSGLFSGGNQQGLPQ